MFSRYLSYQSQSAPTTFCHPFFSGSGSSGFRCISSKAAWSGISSSFTNLVRLRYFQMQNAAITSGMSKYELTKVSADQLPFVNTVYPPVRRIMIHIPSANGVEYRVHRLCQGSRLTGMFCLDMAMRRRWWLKRMEIQLMRTPQDTKSTNQ